VQQADPASSMPKTAFFVDKIRAAPGLFFSKSYFAAILSRSRSFELNSAP
jgi:hypothetical protein